MLAGSFVIDTFFSHIFLVFLFYITPFPSSTPEFVIMGIFFLSFFLPSIFCYVLLPFLFEPPGIVPAHVHLEQHFIEEIFLLLCIVNISGSAVILPILG